MITSKNHPTNYYQGFNWIWSLNVPDKIKHFLWLINHNRLPCNHILQRMGLPINPCCKSCITQNENIPHIFWFCNRANKLWTDLFKKINCPTPHIGNLTCDNFLQAVPKWSKNTMADHHISLQILVIFCLWEIWKCRNELIFNNMTSHPFFRKCLC